MRLSVLVCVLVLFSCGQSPLGAGYSSSAPSATCASGLAGAQTEGDCNTCHTAAGAGGAPGRILIPQ